MRPVPVTAKILTFLQIVCVFCDGASAHTALDEVRLQKELFTNYSSYVRPVLDSDKAVTVEMLYFPVQITALDEKSQVLGTTAWFDIHWTDQLLSWDPAEYNNTSFTFLPKTKIWTPDLIIENSVSTNKGLSDEEINVLIYHTGEVLWRPAKEVRTSCNIDIQNFPFDTQECNIQITKQITNDSLIMLKAVADEVNIQEFQENGQWHLNGVSQSEFTWKSHDGTFTVLKWTITLSRKPKYYMLNVIVPVVILSFLSSCSFLLPLESGEKISFCVTMFLSLSLFLTLIYDSMPQTSASFSYLSIYLSYQQAAGAATVVMEMILLRVYFTEGTYGLPNCIPKSETKRRNVVTAFRENDEDSNCSGKSEQDKCLITYSELAQRLDKLLFVIALCMNSSATVVLLTLII